MGAVFFWAAICAEGVLWACVLHVSLGLAVCFFFKKTQFSGAILPLTAVLYGAVVFAAAIFSEPADISAAILNSSCA